ALEVIVRPANKKINETPSDGEARDQKNGGPQHALGDAHGVDRARLGEAENNGDDHPADRVLTNRRGDDDLPEVASGETHFAHDRRDELDRRNRQRTAKEQRREQTLIGMWQEGFRQPLAEQEAANEWDARTG